MKKTHQKNESCIQAFSDAFASYLLHTGLPNFQVQGEQDRKRHSKRDLLFFQCIIVIPNTHTIAANNLHGLFPPVYSTTYLVVIYTEGDIIMDYSTEYHKNRHAIYKL